MLKTNTSVCPVVRIHEDVTGRRKCLQKTCHLQEIPYWAVGLHPRVRTSWPVYRWSFWLLGGGRIWRCSGDSGSRLGRLAWPLGPEMRTTISCSATVIRWNARKDDSSSLALARKRNVPRHSHVEIAAYLDSFFENIEFLLKNITYSVVNHCYIFGL